MKIFNQQLLDLDYKALGINHNIRALFMFISAAILALLALSCYLMYYYLPDNSPDFIESMVMLFLALMTIVIIGLIIACAINSINNGIKQKTLETKNIIFLATKQIDKELGQQLFYRLSKLYQLYIKRLNNNKLVDNQIKSLLIELDTQIYDNLMLLKNPKTLENNQHLNSMDEKDNHENNEQLQLLEMDTNPIYLKLYKEIIFKEEIEQMEKCFDEVQYNFQYYALHNVHSMIMAFKNDEINSLSEYERRENEIWKILNKIKMKMAENKT